MTSTSPIAGFSRAKSVNVVSVLNPYRIVVKEKLNVHLDAAYSTLEDDLKKIWPSRIKFTEENKPFSGMHVMVRDSEWNISRGIVQEELPNREDTQYSVFTYDHGKIDILTTVNIAPLPGEIKLRLAARAFIVNIVGIQPSRLYTDLSDMLSGSSAKPKYVPGGEWSPAALKFVKQWVSADDILVTVYKSFDNAIKLGELHRPIDPEQKETKFECLSTALVNANFALFNKETAEQQIAYEPACPPSGVDDKHTTTKEGPSSVKTSSPNKSKFVESNRELIDTLNQKSVLFKALQNNCELETSGRKPIDQSSKIETTEKSRENKEPKKVKKYTAFAPIEDIGDSTVTLTNSSRITNNSQKSAFAGCKMPTARKSINVADVPGRNLVRGLDVCEPLESYRKFEFFSHIAKGWGNLQLEEGNEIQRSVWPNFVHKNDIFVIGGAKSGKSLSYLTPMCADLIANETFLNNTEGLGPFGMILCSTASSGIKLEGHGRTLLSSKSTNQLNCVFASEKNKQSLNNLRNGTEIMITTIDMLISCQNKFIPHFMFDRLRYLVFDDAHIIFQERKEQAIKIFKEFKEYVGKQNPRAKLIVCGNEWTPEVEQFYWKISERPIVHIASPLQAVVFSGVNLAMYYTPHNSAIIRAAEIILSGKEHKKSVVVCGSFDSADFVHLELQNKYKLCAHLAADFKPDVLKSVSMLWKNASDEVPQVLVCTDDVLKYMEITDATNLIHYEMEEAGQKVQNNRVTIFARRFACMWSHLRDITVEPNALSWSKRGSFGKKLESHIFLTGKERDLDKIINNFKKIGVQVPLPLDEQADCMFSSKMEKVSVCAGVKMFGWCNNTKLSSCSKRHYFIKSEVETTPTLPRSGQVEVRVIGCQNPSMYICELIRYYEMKGTKKIVNYTGKMREYNKLLKEYYENNNRILPDSFKAGTLCGVVLPNNEGFARGKILEVLTYTSTNFPDSVRIYCFDTGEKKIRTVNEHIFKLPSHISDLPPLCVELILAGIKPPNNEKEYLDKHITYAREKTENKIYLARIVCSLGSTIWVNPLVESTKDDDGKTVTSFSVRQKIARRQMGDISDEHEKTLKKLFGDAGYPMDEFPSQEKLQDDVSFTSTFFQIGDRYNWAYVTVSPMAAPEEHLVAIVFVCNPWLVYGNLVKFEKQLMSLNDDINEDVEQLIETTYPDYSEQFKTFYEVGLVVLAKVPDEDKWHRAIITAQSVVDEETYYNVFFTDFGDTLEVTTTSLFPIKKKFVTLLPFQAIAFNASHVTPKEDHLDDPSAPWSEQCIDFLYSVLIPDGVAADVQVVALNKDPSGESDAVLCRYYSALLFPKNSSTSSDDGDEIGEKLVGKGFAELTRVGEKSLEIVKTALLNKYNEMVSEKKVLDLSDDDSEDEYNYPAIENAPHKENKAYPEGYFDDEGFDVYIPNATNTLNQFGLPVPPQKSIATAINSKSKDVIITSSNGEKLTDTEKEKPAVPPPAKVINVNEEPGLKHPKTYWSQTDAQVQLVIELPDISEYTFKLGDNHRSIYFRTTKPPGYGFDLDVFGSLKDPEEFLTGQYFRVKLQKRLPGHEWKGFHRNYREVKLPWLKEQLTLDLDKYDDSDDEGQKKYIPVDYEKMFPDSEESDDSDDDEALEDFDEDDFEKVDLSGMKASRTPIPM